MADWIELIMACDFGYDMPQEVVDILNCLSNAESVETCKQLPTPDHPFFEGEWYYLLSSDTADLPDNGYFVFLYNEDLKSYHLTMCCKEKMAYPIYGFLHWLAPRSTTQGFVGYIRHSDTPGIFHVYFEAGKAYLAEQSSLEREEITDEMI